VLLLEENKIKRRLGIQLHWYSIMHYTELLPTTMIMIDISPVLLCFKQSPWTVSSSKSIIKKDFAVLMISVSLYVEPHHNESKTYQISQFNSSSMNLTTSIS
jgi:hypothetical protein